MPKVATPLTDIRVRNAKPKEKDYKLSDGHGLYLLVTTKGAKLWRYDYTFGKRKTLALGAYPVVSLLDARQKHLEARKLLESGIDPSDTKKAATAATRAKTINAFEVVALEWFERNKHTWADSHAVTIISRLSRDVFPFIGKDDIGTITAQQVLMVLRRVESRGALESAHRIKTLCSQVFRYAVATGRAERDPIPDLKGALPQPKERHLAAITDPNAVGPLLRALDGYQGNIITRCALRLAPLTFVRPGELRHAEWSEIDLEAGLWSIPSEKMKRDNPHIIPLSRQAIEILQELHPVTGQGRYVFPSARTILSTEQRCMSNNAVLAAMRRMGIEKDEMTGHGFRAMARTILEEVLQCKPELIEHQLSHRPKDPLGRAYNRTTHLEARRQMMQTWADYLDGLKAGAKVVPFKRSEGSI